MQPCEWSITQPSSASFSLNPSSGTMQGEGIIAVAITFRPSHFITERCDVQVGPTLPDLQASHGIGNTRITKQKQRESSSILRSGIAPCQDCRILQNGAHWMSLISRTIAQMALQTPFSLRGNADSRSMRTAGLMAARRKTAGLSKLGDAAEFCSVAQFDSHHAKQLMHAWCFPS